eukprot:ANDGO_01963.mRNA.1 hypothetical protein
MDRGILKENIAPRSSVQVPAYVGGLNNNNSNNGQQLLFKRATAATVGMASPPAMVAAKSPISAPLLSLEQKDRSARDVLHPLLVELRDVFHWRNKSKSGKAFALCMSVFYTLALYDWTLASLLTSMLFWGSAISAVYFKITKRTLSAEQFSIRKIVSKEDAGLLANGILDVLSAAAENVVNVVMVKDVKASAKFLGIVWMLSYVLNAFSFFAMSFFFTAFLFSLPLIPRVKNFLDDENNRKMAMEMKNMFINKAAEIIPRAGHLKQEQMMNRPVIEEPTY